MTVELGGWVIAALMVGFGLGVSFTMKAWSMTDVVAVKEGVTRIAGKYYRLTPAEVK